MTNRPENGFIFFITFLILWSLRTMMLTFNISQIGKIDEIFGTIREYHVSVKLSEGVKAKSFEKEKQLFIDPAKLLPLSRYLVVKIANNTYCVLE